MHNMSDIIEQYIKRLFEEADEDVVEIQRAHIAQRSIVFLLNLTMLLRHVLLMNMVMK